jgi:hypothetical protein
LFATLAGCSLLAACDNSGSTPDVNKVGSNKPKPKPAIAEQMVAAVSTSHSATVIGVYFSLGKTPVVHQALPVDIVLVPHQKLARVVVHFDGQDGITVVSGDAMEPKADVEAESALKHELVLMPTAEGVFMINASVETEGAEGTVSRVFSIPIIVGPSPPNAPVPAPAVETTGGKPQAQPAG